MPIYEQKVISKVISERYQARILPRKRQAILRADRTIVHPTIEDTHIPTKPILSRTAASN